MCWAFVDTWLMDPPEEKLDQIPRQGTREYFYSEHHPHLRRKKKKRIVSKARSDHFGDIEDMYEYLPAREVEVKKSGSKSSSSSKKDVKKVNDGDDEWTYVPAPHGKKPTKHASKPSSKMAVHKVSPASLAPSSFA